MPIGMSMYNTTVVLNGHVVTGWSEDTDCLTLPELTLANIKRGATGDMTATDTGDRGGAVVIKLLPTSESTKFFMQAVASQANGAQIEWDGTIRYNDTGIGVDLVRGVITVAPSAQTLGKGSSNTMAFTIEFEKINADYGTANFSGVNALSN